jgi:hypothetical protein
MIEAIISLSLGYGLEIASIGAGLGSEGSILGT